MLDDEEYQKEYDKAAAELEAAANGATTARDEEGRFKKAEEAPEVPEAKETPAPIEPEPKNEEPEPDPLAEIRAKLDKTEKALKDTQAWGTRNAQELAALKKESEERKRAASRPAILDANPELEEAIKFVAPVAQPQENPRAQWHAIVEAAHPGIFDKSIDPELETALMTRLQANPEALLDPLIAIREITAEKLAHTERVIGKRFAAETAKSREKGAMSVPGAGAGGVAKAAAADPELERAKRYETMPPSEFEKERRKVLGY